MESSSNNVNSSNDDDNDDGKNKDVVAKKNDTNDTNSSHDNIHHTNTNNSIVQSPSLLNKTDPLVSDPGSSSYTATKEKRVRNDVPSGKFSVENDSISSASQQDEGDIEESKTEDANELVPLMVDAMESMNDKMNTLKQKQEDYEVKTDRKLKKHESILKKHDKELKGIARRRGWGAGENGKLKDGIQKIEDSTGRKADTFDETDWASVVEASDLSGRTATECEEHFNRSSTVNNDLRKQRDLSVEERTCVLITFLSRQQLLKKDKTYPKIAEAIQKEHHFNVSPSLVNSFAVKILGMIRNAGDANVEELNCLLELSLGNADMERLVQMAHDRDRASKESDTLSAPQEEVTISGESSISSALTGSVVASKASDETSSTAPSSDASSSLTLSSSTTTLTMDKSTARSKPSSNKTLPIVEIAQEDDKATIENPPLEAKMSGGEGNATQQSGEVVEPDNNRLDLTEMSQKSKQMNILKMITSKDRKKQAVGLEQLEYFLKNTCWTKDARSFFFREFLTTLNVDDCLKSRFPGVTGSAISVVSAIVKHHCKALTLSKVERILFLAIDICGRNGEAAFQHQGASFLYSLISVDEPVFISLLTKKILDTKLSDRGLIHCIHTLMMILRISKQVDLTVVRPKHNAAGQKETLQEQIESAVQFALNNLRPSLSNAYSANKLARLAIDIKDAHFKLCAAFVSIGGDTSNIAMSKRKRNAYEKVKTEDDLAWSVNGVLYNKYGPPVQQAARKPLGTLSGSRNVSQATGGKARR